MLYFIHTHTRTNTHTHTQTHPYTQVALGQLYYYGARGVEQSYPEALKWYLLAAEQVCVSCVCVCVCVCVCARVCVCACVCV